MVLKKQAWYCTQAISKMAWNSTGTSCYTNRYPRVYSHTLTAPMCWYDYGCIKMLHLFPTALCMACRHGDPELVELTHRISETHEGLFFADGRENLLESNLRIDDMGRSLMLDLDSKQWHGCRLTLVGCPHVHLSGHVNVHALCYMSCHTCNCKCASLCWTISGA